MRKLLAPPVLLTLCLPAQAGSISSAYTDLDAGKHCVTLASSSGGEGDWADMVCSGYRGYPVFIYYSDARESAFYGFPPAGDDAPAWESFQAFNATGPKIEWRIETDGDKARPFATIHRWTISNGEDAYSLREVLVVAKVGQPADREGCAVGLVMATGNPRANEQARKIADEKARGFACGTDERITVGAKEPGFQRTE
jgi:hypothetical protein